MPSKREVIATDGFALRKTFLLSLKECLVLLPGTITVQTSEVSLEGEAATASAFVWGEGTVLFVGVFALARHAPFVNIEAFTPRQPPLAYLLWSTRDE